MQPSQAHFLSLFNENYRPKFNEKLFERSDDEIIQELLKIIYSCQREQNGFTFKVKNYQLIEDYAQIKEILFNYEESMRKGKNKKKINRYEFIDLKDTDLKLLIITYYIQVGDDAIELVNYIEVPRVVNKYYFRLAGNLYSAMYQIVDGSTYNSSTSKNSRCDNICFKTAFMPIRLYKSSYSIKLASGEEHTLTNFSIATFNKLFSSFKYILARFGLYGTFQFMNINVISISKDAVEDDKLYSFKTNSSEVFVNVPKFVCDGDMVVQSLVCSICLCINKNTKYENIFNQSYWLQMLGMEFGNASEGKGLSLLQSLEGVYDISTKEGLHLPPEKKETIYDIIKWMIQEFPALNAKDNLDISTKRVRYAPYIASLFGMKLATIMHSLTDLAAKNKLKMDVVIKKMRSIKPSYLIDSLAKCQLVVYRNLVNDLDSITAIKFTYKGISGIGNKTNVSVPEIYKTIHPSHLGRVDMDSSSKSDPGLSGILCPLTNIYDDSFSEYDEPVTWDEGFNKLMTEYQSLEGLKNVYTVRQQVFGEDNSETINSVQCTIDIMKELMSPIYEVECSTEYGIVPLEEGGYIYYEQ